MKNKMSEINLENVSPSNSHQGFSYPRTLSPEWMNQKMLACMRKTDLLENDGASLLRCFTVSSAFLPFVNIQIRFLVKQRCLCII